MFTHTTTTHGTVRRIARRLYIIACIIVLLLICSEFGLKYYYENHPDLIDKNPWAIDTPVKEYNSPFIYNYNDPQTMYAKNNYFMRRSTDVTADPPAGTDRILSYGDSVGLGLYVGTDETYSAVLEHLLNQDGNKRYEVDNMSRGSMPSIYAMHLKVDVKKFKPRRVIMEIELLNDIADEALIGYSGTDTYNMPAGITSSRYYPGFLKMPPTRMNPDYWERSYIRKFLFDMDRKYNVLMETYFPNPVFSAKSDEYFYNLNYDKHLLTRDRLTMGFDRMMSTIKGIQQYLADSNIDFLLVILPSAYDYTTVSAVYYHPEYPQYSPGARRWYAKAVERANKLGIHAIGLYDTFNSAIQTTGGLYFQDFCHPLQNGHALIAQAIYDYYKTTYK